tara:strand:+ start:5140 stop:5511 length:372 start_codon:yes stop_codon:yes gene_type:complete
MIKFKKAVLFLKHYWYFPVLFIVAAVAFIVHRKKVEMLIDILVGSMESHKREIEVLNEAERKKSERLESAALDHSKELQEIFSDEALALEDAGKQKEKREKSLQELEMEMLADEMKKAFKKES